METVLPYILYALLAIGGAWILRYVLRWCVNVLNRIFYVLFKVLCAFFDILNWLQRFMSKPWRTLFKNHHGSDKYNKFRRTFWNIVKMPLYLVLTPLRVANAAFYNLIVHLFFESFNYIAEFLDPTSKVEGGKNVFVWIVMLPWRALKYSWHLILTLVESIVWTVIDTFVPALTLYHGTDYKASESITQSPGRIKDSKSTGVWIVGSGNWAGDGIYFAPARCTAKYYARCNEQNAIIVCRVSLGRVLDIGMAPKAVFNSCGNANAHLATEWGLKNGYTTGEWWRKGRNWWEYCMYDWKNRYNQSWRIRPLYIEELNSIRVHRISGGMSHWLFNRMVLNDLLAK